MLIVPKLKRMCAPSKTIVFVDTFGRAGGMLDIDGSVGSRGLRHWNTPLLNEPTTDGHHLRWLNLPMGMHKFSETNPVQRVPHDQISFGHCARHFACCPMTFSYYCHEGYVI